MMKVEYFEKGMRVRYIPDHVEPGDRSHKDIQEGCVKSKNDTYVFVLYDNLECRMITGDEPYTAQATYPRNLEVIGRHGN